MSATNRAFEYAWRWPRVRFTDVERPCWRVGLLRWQGVVIGLGFVFGARQMCVHWKRVR